VRSLPHLNLRYCYDNAVAESVFGSLKQEMVYLENVFETREKGRIKILKYINWYLKGIIYNSERLHSTIGYVSPNDFEKGNVTKVVA